MRQCRPPRSAAGHNYSGVDTVCSLRLGLAPIIARAPGMRLLFSVNAAAVGIGVDLAQHFGAAQRLHLTEDPVAPLQDITRRRRRRSMLGIRQHRREDRGVASRQARGRPVKKALGRRLGAIGSITELGDVQIDLEDAPLRPEPFDQQREVRLETLAEIAPAGPKIQILRHLLADGARAAHAMAVLVELIGLLDGLDVESPVVGEFLILRGDHGERQIGRDAREIRPTCAGTRSCGRG